MLRARLFGRLAVEVDGRAMPDIAGLKPRSVLAWLLLHPGPHSRARVASLFWPEVLDTSARASLRNALWTIRVALDTAGGAAYLEAGRDSVGIASRSPRKIDVEEFDRLAGVDDPAGLQEALGLVGGPLLADLADDWVLEARDAYRDRVAEVALRLADKAEEHGDLRDAVAWTRRALVHVPLRESAHRALMRRLDAAGERAESLAAFGRCRAVLAAEFGTLPSKATRDLAARVQDGARSHHDVPFAYRAEVASTADQLDGTRRGVTVRSPTTEEPTHGPGDVLEAGRGHMPQAPIPRQPGPALAGRAYEIEALAAAWAGARCRRGGVVLISGAAGLGKSRLAAELMARAAGDGARQGMGAAFELAGGPPYAPWSEALRELVADVSPPPADAAWPADLARLCRSVEWRWGRRASPPALDPEQERAWVFEAVAEALAWLARERPVLIVLEDLHLADRASIALLAYAGRKLAGLPALLVATRRPATSRQDLALAIDALSRGAALTAQLVLEPLTPEETGRIVDALAPRLAAQTRARVVAAAEGNPLLAREAARAAAAGRDLSQGLRDWVRASLARLPGSARLLVDALAAAGRPLELGETADLVGAEPLGEALDAACREELLDAGDRRVRFTHALVREACYAELGPVRRTWLHGRIADILDARPGRAVAEIARHLLLAGRQEEARSYLVTAARQARAMGALDEAANFLREAATAAADMPALAAEMWLALAETEAWRNSKDEHDAAFTRARALLERSGEWAALAGAYVTRGRCLRTTLCFPRDSLVAYERALTIIDEVGMDAPELRALALAGRAWVEAANGDVCRGRAFVAEAEALPEVRDDAVLSAEVGLARGATLLRSRRFAGAERESERAAELAHRAGRADLADLGLLQVAMAAAAQGMSTRALEIAQRVLHGRSGTYVRAEAHAARAYGLSRMGRYAEAYDAARAELALLARVGEPAQESTAVYDVGSIALAAGRHEEAVERLSAVLSAPGGQFPHALARLRLAEARLRVGEPDRADAELSSVPYEPVGPADLPETLVPQLERLQGLVAAAHGEPVLALERLASAEEGWRRLFAAASEDDPYGANLVALGRSPLEGLVEPGVELGRVLAERAALLAQRGRTTEAREAAGEAARLATAMAYDGYRDVLRSIGQE